MDRKKRNKRAFNIAMIAGILLILSGTTGVASLVKIEEIVFRYADIWLISFIFPFLLFIASLGGFTIMFGGYLILREQIRTGKFVISLGAGFGIISLLSNIFVAIITLHFPIEWFLSFATIGLILSLVARRMAKAKS